jgi:hypothetical protein
MRWTLVLLAIVSLFVACNGGTPTPMPTPCPTLETTPNCDATILPVWTRVVAAEATLAEVETLVALVIPTCGALWDACCAPATMTAAAPTATPVYATPQPTYTPYPTATAAPVLCRRCIANQPMPYNCPAGYFCKACDACKSLCVRNTSPSADCNYCLTLVIP